MLIETILALTLFGSAAFTPLPDATTEIRQVIDRQQDDWNRGDIEAFMNGYEKSDRLIFTSGGQVRRGWAATIERYRNTYPDRSAMGTLTFSGIEIRQIGPTAAVVLGNYELKRAADRPSGVFTIVLEKGPAGWKIVHDHTSASGTHQ